MLQKQNAVIESYLWSGREEIAAMARRYKRLSYLPRAIGEAFSASFAATISSAAFTASSSDKFVESKITASGGWLQGRVRPVSVALVSCMQIADYILRLNGGFRSELVETAHSAHFRSGIQENLCVGMRKDHGPDVAPFHYHTASGAHLLLQSNHPGPNREGIR